MPVRPKTREAHDLIVAGVVEIVEADLAGRHELGWIASRLGYSERHMRRVLAAYGIRWRPWLAEARMRRAAELLLTGRYPHQVARKVGYKPDHFAAPFANYVGLRPSEARRVGFLQRQLERLATYPPRSADVAANCRVVDRWTRLHIEAMSLRLRARSGTPVAAALECAVGCVPPRRPRAVPRGRHRRQIALGEALRAAVNEPSVQADVAPARWARAAKTSRVRRPGPRSAEAGSPQARREAPP
jgi:AraC-like DNA-binding protein